MELKCVFGIKQTIMLILVLTCRQAEGQKLFVGANALFPLDYKGNGWEGEISAIPGNKTFYRIGFGQAGFREGDYSPDYIKGRFVAISVSRLKRLWMIKPFSMFYGVQFIHSRQNEVYNFRFGRTSFNQISIEQHKMRYYATGINWGVSFFMTKRISLDITHQLNVLLHYTGGAEQTMNRYIFGVGTEAAGNPELEAPLRNRVMLNLRVRLLNR